MLKIYKVRTESLVIAEDEKDAKNQVEIEPEIEVFSGELKALVFHMISCRNMLREFDRSKSPDSDRCLVRQMLLEHARPLGVTEDIVILIVREFFDWDESELIDKFS